MGYRDLSGGGGGGGAITKLSNDALSAHVPDSTATGGNDRGANAVDLQTVRTSSSQVASGQESVVLGGKRNTASGLRSVVGGGGPDNTASAQESVIGGGYQNQTLGTRSVIAGGYKNKTQTGSYGAVVGGWENIAEADLATVGGAYAHGYLLGQVAFAAGQFSTTGDVQSSTLIPSAETADATPTVLVPWYATNIVIPAEKVWAFKGMLVAKEPATGEVAIWEYSGGIKRLGNVTTLVGTPTVTQLAVDAGASAWAVAITADDTNEALAIEVTGEAAKTIRWVSTLNLTEVA